MQNIMTLFLFILVLNGCSLKPTYVEPKTNEKHANITIRIDQTSDIVSKIEIKAIKGINVSENKETYRLPIGTPSILVTANGPKKSKLLDYFSFKTVNKGHYFLSIEEDVSDISIFIRNEFDNVIVKRRLTQSTRLSL